MHCTRAPPVAEESERIRVKKKIQLLSKQYNEIVKRRTDISDVRDGFDGFVLLLLHLRGNDSWSVDGKTGGTRLALSHGDPFWGPLDFIVNNR